MLIIDQIKKRESFTPTENQLAEYIVAHNREVMSMTLDEFSEKAYVSKSTIIRFCKKLGYKGHKELCVELAREVNSFLVQNDRTASSMLIQAGDDHKTAGQRLLAMNYRAMTETFQGLDLDYVYEAAEVIRDRRKTMIYGYAESFAISMNFQMKLLHIQKDASIITNPGAILDYAGALDEDSAAVFISYEGNNEIMAQSGQLLKEKNIPVILITGPNAGSLEIYADYIIRSMYDEEKPNIGPLASVSSLNFLANLLYTYIFSMDYEKNMSIINTMEERKKGLKL